MPYLILPPTQYLADHQEVPKQIQEQAKNYQRKLADELNLKLPLFTVDKGAYKGTQVFEWEQKFNGILLTNMMFEKGKRYTKEIIKTASLLKQDDCTHLGSVWTIDNKQNISFPLENSQLKMSDIVTRNFKLFSPVKINYEVQKLEKNSAEIFNLVLQEELAKKNSFIVSNEGRFFCKAQYLNNIILKNENFFPSKPHKVYTIKVSSVDGNKSKINYNVIVNSGVFGQKNEKWNEKKENENFDPQNIAKDISTKIASSQDDLSSQEFKIIKRSGAWVYLNRGRAFGLKIGMRLVDNHGSTLHIIRYAPKLDGELDGAVAFIRHENKEFPLVINNVLRLDPTVYPK